MLLKSLSEQPDISRFQCIHNTCILQQQTNRSAKENNRSMTVCAGYDSVLVRKKGGTSIRLYFSRSDILGNMPIESFTGIRYFKIILFKSKQIQALAYFS